MLSLTYYQSRKNKYIAKDMQTSDSSVTDENIYEGHCEWHEKVDTSAKATKCGSGNE